MFLKKVSRETLIKDPRVVISVLIETKNNYMYMVWYLDQVVRLLVLILH